MASCFPCFGAQARDRRQKANEAQVLAAKAIATNEAGSAAASQPARLPNSTSKVRTQALPAPVPPVVCSHIAAL